MGCRSQPRCARSEREEQKHDHANEDGAPEERNAEVHMVARHPGSVGGDGDALLIQVKGADGTQKNDTPLRSEGEKGDPFEV